MQKLMVGAVLALVLACFFLDGLDGYDPEQQIAGKKVQPHAHTRTRTLTHPEGVLGMIHAVHYADAHTHPLRPCRS